MSKNIVVATYATQRYAYALPNVGRRISSAICHSGIKKGDFIFVGDKTEKIKETALLYIGEVLPKGWNFHFIALDLDDNLKNYKEDAQLLIAQMQSCAFAKARLLDADYFWSIESDVLVPYNALSVSLDILKFDEGYYDIAMCTYPSQGGGSFLGGRGDYRHHISEDFSLDEKELSPELKEEIKEREKESARDGFEPSKVWKERAKEIGEAIKVAPPQGNVFEMNAKKWRQRGWMEFAYPAIGKGAIVPTDWVGLGCTMLSKKALAMAHFDGYEGKGTQDLYIGWTCWKPNGLNMCVTTHAVCDHIIRKRKGEEQDFEEFTHVRAYHQPDGELQGHLRQAHGKFYTFKAGEKQVTIKSPKIGHQKDT